jgi:hypothetical protein
MNTDEGVSDRGGERRPGSCSRIVMAGVDFGAANALKM